MRPTTAQRSTALLALLALPLGPALLRAHDAHEVHRWCEVHRHVVHGEAARAAQEAPEEPGFVAGEAAFPEQECEAPPGLRRPGLHPAGEPNPLPPPRVAPAFAGQSDRALPAPLSRAPKHGPPAR